MTAVGNDEIEKLAVGAMLASAQNDVVGLGRLVETLRREELIGCLAYCARFAVSYAQHNAVDDDDFPAALRGYAMKLAARPGPGGARRGGDPGGPSA